MVAWVACLHEWRASVGHVLTWVTWFACLRGLHVSVGDVGGVSALVRCLVCLHGWREWRTKVSSVGDIGRNTRVVS